MNESLCTLAAPCVHEQTIRKSRFLAQALPVADADAAMALIAEHGVADASHNCWAYKVGQAYRFHDDGEPGGTAGKPILQAIEGQAMDNVAVIVSRWFGGIKLGAGGLIRAYGGTAAECLRRADKSPIVAMTHLGFRCTFAELPLLKARMQALQVEMHQEAFGHEEVELHVAMPSQYFEEFTQLLADITRGRSTPRVPVGFE